MTVAQTKWMEELKGSLDNITKIVAQFRADLLPQFKLVVMLDKQREAGDILQLVWEAALDKSWIHEIPSWLTLCDLCSEHVFSDLEQDEVAD